MKVLSAGELSQASSWMLVTDPKLLQPGWRRADSKPVYLVLINKMAGKNELIRHYMSTIRDEFDFYGV